MEEDPFTLRVIPDPFRSIVIDGDDPLPPWDARGVAPPHASHHSFDFTPRLNSALDTVFPAGHETRTRRTAGSGLSDRRSRPQGPGVRPRETVVAHSADRLAKAIVLGTHSPGDPRTLTAWGQHVGASRGTLRMWCKAAGVSARSCLDFLRILRAVTVAGDQAWDLRSILDVVDGRSLLNLLGRGEVRDLCRGNAPTVEDFLLRQRFLLDQQLLQAVRRRLDADRGDEGGREA